MADADPEWLLVAKRQKDKTRTLAERVKDQGKIIDNLLPLRGQVKELQHEIKSIQKDLSSAQQAGENLSTLAEQVQSHSRILDSHQKQMEGLLEVKSLGNDLSLLQQELVNTTAMAERIQELLPLREQMNELRNEVQSLQKKPQSAQRAEQHAWAQHESDIIKANLRITKLEFDKKALAKEIEQVRAQTAQSVADLLQHSRNAHYREIAQLQTQYQQQTEEMARLKMDNQRLLAALEKHSNETSDPHDDVHKVDLTSQALESNSSNHPRTTDFPPNVQNFLDKYPLRDRNWSGQAQLGSSPYRDDVETRNLTEDGEQSPSMSATAFSTPPCRMHIEPPVVARKQAETHQIMLPTIVLEPQGKRPLDEYVTCSEDTIVPLLLAYERNIVKAFVAGLRDEEQKTIVWRSLDDTAWTWKVAFEEISRIDREAIEATRTTNSEQPTTPQSRTPQPRTPQPRTQNGRYAKKRRM